MPTSDGVPSTPDLANPMTTGDRIQYVNLTRSEAARLVAGRIPRDRAVAGLVARSAKPAPLLGGRSINMR